MNTSLWIVILISFVFVIFLMGYSLPPFLEVGFGQGGEKTQEETISEEELMKQFENLYQDEETESESE